MKFVLWSSRPGKSQNGQGRFSALSFLETPCNSMCHKVYEAAAASRPNRLTGSCDSKARVTGVNVLLLPCSWDDLGELNKCGTATSQADDKIMLPNKHNPVSDSAYIPWLAQ